MNNDAKITWKEKLFKLNELKVINNTEMITKSMSE